MKYTYHSPSDFERNCPCSYLLTGYVQSIFSNDSSIYFHSGHKSNFEDDTYVATYDVLTKSSKYAIEVQCSKNSDNTYSYKTLSKTEIL